MEQISLGHRYKECRPQRISSSPSKLLVGKDVLKELEERRSSPSVVAKLMGIDVLPPTYVANKRHQQFKDVFEVSEELPETFTKEMSYHFPKGLPSLKRSAMKLKKLMPSKSPYCDETFDNEVEYNNGLDRLNPLEIDNPLFEKCPRDLNYSPNNQHEKDTAGTFRKYPVGLANSSLKDIKNMSRGNYGDFNNIVVLEPGLGNSHDPENSFSMSLLSHDNCNSRRNRKKKLGESVVMSNERVSQHLLDTVNVARIKRERYLTSDAINSLSKGEEPSFDQFNIVDMNSAGSFQMYSGDDIDSRQNKSSSSSLPGKSFRKYDEGDVGSRTLAQMFALSDSERVKKNLNPHAQIQHNKLDQGKGHNKEGCFIVLPKHGSPLSLHTSLDRSSSCEGSPNSEIFPDPSVSYNNGKVTFDSFLAKRRLKQIASGRQNNLRNASVVKSLALEQRRPASPSLDDFRCHSWRPSDNVSTSVCTNERVLFATDKGLIHEPAETVPSSFQLQLSREQKVSATPLQCHDYESVSISNHDDLAKSRKGLEEFEQPSPVSILQPPTDEDSCCSGFFKNDLQDMLSMETRIDHRRFRDEPEVSTISSDDGNDSSYKSLEAFQVEEDRDFSYLLDILISSGMIVSTDWQLLCKSWHSSSFPVAPQVFERLESKYAKMTSWPKPERRLMFDLANSDDKVLDPNWLELGDDIYTVGKHISMMLHDDLLEEVILEFLSLSGSAAACM
ncbi:unnamed protein product [Triticum turgidum subsp. durum]|uniref:DUF4378 domain-containing protein n=1 Tax=Triticum turgidum subsp. durum TaxID=4567 RepID=A0A9R0W8E5_TRITD|nr:unnamed protein product [Triticum turgidum subsp. durum]